MADPISKKRKERIAREVELRRAGWTLRAIADRVGISETTVFKDLKSADQEGMPEFVRDTLGRKRKARVPRGERPKEPTGESVEEGAGT